VLTAKRLVPLLTQLPFCNDHALLHKSTFHCWVAGTSPLYTVSVISENITINWLNKV